MPCKQLTNIIKTLPQEQQDKIEEIDVDTCDHNMLKKYNIRSVPTLVVLNDEGGVTKTLLGMQSKQQMIELLS